MNTGESIIKEYEELTARRNEWIRSQEKKIEDLKQEAASLYREYQASRHKYLKDEFDALKVRFDENLDEVIDCAGFDVQIDKVANQYKRGIIWYGELLDWVINKRKFR